MFWNIRPHVSNINFTAPTEILVDAQSTVIFPVEYHPKLMTLSDLDMGILTLPLDDKEIIYSLVGKALPPAPEKKMIIEIRAKQNHCQSLKVRNWSNVLLCCEVKTLLQTTPTPKTLYKTFGLESIDLKQNEVKTYKWNIYVINEEVLDFHVIFQDRITREYIYYDITVKVMPPLQQVLTELVTCVRHPVKTKIKLENPINIPVIFNLSGGPQEMLYEKVIALQPYTKTEVEVSYLPLKAGEIAATIEARSNELGTIGYHFKIVVNPPPIEHLIMFVAELGFKGYENAVIKNTFSVPLDVSAKFDNLEFSIEKLNQITPGEIGTIPIKFEPSNLGILESQVILTSPSSGAYIFPLYGECIPPTPKGPYSIKPGGITSINFFNPFWDTHVFYYSTDSDLFDAKLKYEEIRSRKSTKIIVGHPYNKSNTNSNYPMTGKLIVSSGNPDEVVECVKWFFYLQTDM